MYKHTHFLPPAIVTTQSGTYIVPGWTLVPKGTTLAEVEHVKPETKKPNVYVVTGSKGDKYNVTVTDKRISCDCPAGKFRGKCKHIEQIKSKINA
jgi:hypothetical protein